MFELLYTSLSPTGLTNDDLIELLESARLKNEGLGITGMMIYHDREIMQILEGEKEDVKALFQTILEDNRHTSVNVFYQGDIGERAFSGWSMALKVLDEKTIKMVAVDYEGSGQKVSAISMLVDNQNRGKKTFLSLLETI